MFIHIGKSGSRTRSRTVSMGSRMLSIAEVFNFLRKYSAPAPGGKVYSWGPGAMRLSMMSLSMIRPSTLQS